MAQEETKTDYMTIICMLIGFVMLIYIGLLALFMFYPPAFKSLVADPMFLYEKFCTATRIAIFYGLLTRKNPKA